MQQGVRQGGGCSGRKQSMEAILAYEYLFFLLPDRRPG